MSTLGTFFRKTGRGGALRLKNGDAFAACADKFGITAREAEIIRLLIEGRDTRRITEALFISDHTVKNHIHNIYRKLGIRNRIQLVRCFQTALEDPGRANGAGVAEAPASPGAQAAAAAVLRRMALPGLLVLALSAAALVAWKPWGRAPRAAAPPVPALAILDFENVSGDPDLAKWVTGFPTLLTTDLLQSKRIRAVGDDLVYGALKKHGLDGTGRFSRQELKQLARELQADYLLSGSLMKAGGSIVITAFVHDARTGATVRTESVECPDERSLLREAETLARQVKAGFDRTPPLEEDVDPDLELLTTSYALAYRYYAEALRYHRTGDYEQSLLMLRKAVELDPEFAMAYRLMSVDARNLGYFTQEADYMRTAFDLSARLPENSRERCLIRGDYYSLSESTFALSVEAFKLVLRDHPDDLVANNNLGMLYYDLEDYDAAARSAGVPIRRGTDHPFPYHTKAAALRALGQTAEAVRLLESYLDKRPANRLILWTLAGIHLGARDYAAALDALDRGEAVFPDPSWAELRGAVLFHTQGAAAAREEFRKLFLMEEAPWRLKGYERLGNVALSGGRFGEAAEEFERGAALAETTGQHDWVAGLRRQRGRTLLAAGDVPGALGEARKSVEAAKATGGPYCLARSLLFLAETRMSGTGGLAEDQGLAEQFQALASSAPTGRVRRSYDFFRGLVELDAGRPAEAVKILDKAVASIVRRDGLDVNDFVFRSYLASAKEQAGDLKGAAEILRRLLETPGDRLDFDGAFAKAVLGLARLEDRLGRRAAARAGYGRFLELWKDADPGRPEVAEAQTRAR